MKVIIALGVTVVVFVLGFIAWLTGGSPVAFLAGVLLLVFIGAWGAAKAGIVTLPSIVRTILGWATMLCLIVIVWTVGDNWWEAKKAEKVVAEAKAAAERKATAAVEMVETKVLIPRFDGFTPCDPEINFTFELDTQGDAIFLKFPGVSTLVKYSGKGKLKAPEERRSGPVDIISQDSKKQARVRIWEVTIIKERKQRP